MKTLPKLLLAIGLGCTPLAAAWAQPPPWAPAHGYRTTVVHRYTYYPSRQIYYAPDRRVWFWLDSGVWRVGARLPATYLRFAVDGISIELGTDRPYMVRRDTWIYDRPNRRYVDRDVWRWHHGYDYRYHHDDDRYDRYRRDMRHDRHEHYQRYRRDARDGRDYRDRRDFSRDHRERD